MSVRKMQQELEQWGQWARATERTGGVKQYVCPTYTMMLQAIGQKSRSGVAVMLDDDALLAVDQLVQALKRSRPELYQWVVGIYLNGYKVAQLAHMTKVSRRTIDSYLLAAESWLDARLDTLCEMAEKVA